MTIAIMAMTWLFVAPLLMLLGSSWLLPNYSITAFQMAALASIAGVVMGGRRVETLQGHQLPRVAVHRRTLPRKPTMRKLCMQNRAADCRRDRPTEPLLNPPPAPGPPPPPWPCSAKPVPRARSRASAWR